MRITSKGQVTIPLEVRERTGLLLNTEVERYRGEHMGILMTMMTMMTTTGEARR